MNGTFKVGMHHPPVTWGRMTMCQAMGASHAFLEQPGKLRLLVRGRSLADLVAEGGRALGTRLCGQDKRGPSGPWLDVEIHASSPEAVLADWLNRLLYLAGRDRWAPVECQVIEVSDSNLHARVRGVPLRGRPHLEKAVIRSSSLIAPGGRGLQAEVILESRGRGSLPAHRAPEGPASPKGRG